MKLYAVLAVSVALLPLVLYLTAICYGQARGWWSLKKFYGAFFQAGAVVTVKSQTITNRDASPVVVSSRAGFRAPMMHAREVVAITSGDSANSKYLCFELPSNAVVISVRVSAPDIGTTTTFDVGLYQTTKGGSAVVDADFFKAAHIVNAGATTKSEVSMSNIITVANSMKKIWEHLLLAADSQLNYDVILTLVGAADGSGAVLVECDYIVG